MTGVNHSAMYFAAQAVTTSIIGAVASSLVYENVKMIFAFYEANGAYRMSAHSKDCSLLEYFKYVEDNAWPNFTKISGGHPNRAGGGVLNNEPEFCHNWVQKIISCEDFLDK